MSLILSIIFLTSSAVAGFTPRRNVAAPRRALDTRTRRALTRRALDTRAARSGVHMSSRALLARGGGRAAKEAQLHIAGKLYPMLRETILSTERAAGALRSVLDAAAFSDLLVMVTLYASATPLARACWLLGRKVVKRGGEYEGSYLQLLSRGAKRLARTSSCVDACLDARRGVP